MLPYYEGRVPHHPCSPSSLAKAAAPERASTELGADFCRLRMPSLLPRFRPSQEPLVLRKQQCLHDYDSFSTLSLYIKLQSTVPYSRLVMAPPSRSPTPPSTKRLLQELKTNAEEPSSILQSLGPVSEAEILHWEAVMKGVLGTAYEGK